MFTPFEAIAIIFLGFLVIAICMLVGWGFGSAIRAGMHEWNIGIGGAIVLFFCIAWKFIYQDTGDDVSVLGAMGIVIIALLVIAAFAALGELFTWGLRAHNDWDTTPSAKKRTLSAVVGVPVFVLALGVIAFPILVG